MLIEKYIPRYTVEDYKCWDGDWELIDGIVFAMTPSPSGKHQKISARISQLLLNELDKCEKSNVYIELDWIVNENTVVRPDISITCKEIEKFMKSPPKVIFEIVSKTTVIRDEKIKYELYKEEKVKYYVLVYPELKKVRAFRLLKDKYDKFFDDEEGNLMLEVCNCPMKIDVEKIFK